MAQWDSGVSPPRDQIHAEVLAHEAVDYARRSSQAEFVDLVVVWLALVTAGEFGPLESAFYRACHPKGSAVRRSAHGADHLDLSAISQLRQLGNVRTSRSATA